MSKKGDRARTARHEAAHVLVARLVGVPIVTSDVRRRTVVRGGESFLSGGWTDNGREEVKAINDALMGPDTASAEEAARLRRHLLVSVATFSLEDDEEALADDQRSGRMIASRLAGGRFVYATPLTPGGHRSGRFEGADFDRAEREYSYAVHIAEAMLSKHGGALAGVTAKLRDLGRITGEQVDALLDRLGEWTRYEPSAPPNDSTEDPTRAPGPGPAG